MYEDVAVLLVFPPVVAMALRTLTVLSLLCARLIVDLEYISNNA